MGYTHLAKEHLRALVEQEPKREELRDLAQTAKSPERHWDARGLSACIAAMWRPVPQPGEPKSIGDGLKTGGQLCVPLSPLSSPQLSPQAGICSRTWGLLFLEGLVPLKHKDEVTRPIAWRKPVTI